MYTLYNKRFRPFIMISMDENIKEVTSRIAHLEHFSLNFSSASFVVRINLLHPLKPSFFLYGFCFDHFHVFLSTFQVSFNLKVILYIAIIFQNIVTEFN